MAHSESDASSIASTTSSGGLSLQRTAARVAPPSIEFDIDTVSTTSSTSDASSGGLSTSDGTASTGSGGLSVNGTASRAAHPGGDGTTLMDLFAVQLEVSDKNKIGWILSLCVSIWPSGKMAMVTVLKDCSGGSRISRRGLPPSRGRQLPMRLRFVKFVSKRKNQCPLGVRAPCGSATGL